MFSGEFCEFFKNNFFIEHLRWLLLLYVFDHSMILMESDSVYDFTFVRKEDLMVIQNFLVSITVLEFKGTLMQIWKCTNIFFLM